MAKNVPKKWKKGEGSKPNNYSKVQMYAGHLALHLHTKMMQFCISKRYFPMMDSSRFDRHAFFIFAKCLMHEQFGRLKLALP